MSPRPEEGESPRNVLCKLLTSPVDQVAMMVAEFLYVLCKESTARLVKYTGYGNAAGLLARRGLMLGGVGGRSGTGGSGGQDEVGDYSDEDSDSDTEEYLDNAHK